MQRCLGPEHESATTAGITLLQAQQLHVPNELANEQRAMLALMMTESRVTTPITCSQQGCQNNAGQPVQTSITKTIQVMYVRIATMHVRHAKDQILPTVIHALIHRQYLMGVQVAAYVIQVGTIV